MIFNSITAIALALRYNWCQVLRHPLRMFDQLIPWRGKCGSIGWNGGCFPVPYSFTRGPRRGGMCTFLGTSITRMRGRIMISYSTCIMMNVIVMHRRGRIRGPWR